MTHHPSTPPLPMMPPLPTTPCWRSTSQWHQNSTPGLGFPPGGYTQQAAQPPIWNGASGGQGGSTSSAGSGYNTKSVSMGCTAAPTPLWMASWSSFYNPWAGSIQMWPMCSYAGLAAARPSSRHPEAYSVYWTFVPQVLCWPNSWFAPR